MFHSSLRVRAAACAAATLILGATLSSIALAAPGDAVQPPIPECIGIGVAFDGTHILYTCAGDPTIYKTNLTGAALGSVATADAVGAPVSVDAIAWDTNEGKLWGGDLDGAGNCRIWSIDMGTGLATPRFSFVAPNCDTSFYDGITVDTVTNTLWLSPDVSGFIYHYTKAGAEIVADRIDFAALTPPGEPDLNSGLAIGLDGTLFGGTDGFGKIVEIGSPGPAATFLGDFATVSGRDEDLECGPVVNGSETILSKEFEGPIDVLEAPAGTCKSQTEGHRMTGGGTIKGTTTRHGLELHCDTSHIPNRLEVNWGKTNKFHLETLTSAACSDDPSISPNPPAAGFDTYVGKGTGRYNGVPGATAEWTFTDAGEPGVNDVAKLLIKDAGGNTVLSVGGTLKQGNQQAHK